MNKNIFALHENLCAKYKLRRFKRNIQMSRVYAGGLFAFKNKKKIFNNFDALL